MSTNARCAIALAPAWHTAALVALLLAVSSTGAWLASRSSAIAAAPPSSRITAVYLPVIGVSWALAIYVCRIGRAHNAFASLIGRRWNSVARASTDVALALIGWVAIVAFDLAWARWLGGERGGIATMLPHTWAERLTWVAVALSVGVCEEIVYRGYLQTQLSAFARSATIGIVLQAILFGIAHGEQGAGAVIRMTIYGVAFGALARWRRSLLPGITCHVVIDLASGLL